MLTRLPTYQFLSGIDTAVLCARIMREVTTIAGRHNIPLDDNGGMPVIEVVNDSEDAAVSALNGFSKILEENAPDHRMSPLQDLENGRRLEIDATIGYAVEEARQVRVPVPTLEMCYELLKGINRFL